MYQAACKIGSDFLAFGFRCKKSTLEGCAGFGFTGKILPVCFLASCVRRSQVCPSCVQITQKAGKKAAQKRQKATKTEHKNVGLYAQKTPHSAYWKILKNATNALYCDFSLAYWTGFSILRNFPSVLIYALSSILPWTPILRFFPSILCSDSLTFAHICSVSALICRWDKLYSSASQNRRMGVFVRFSHIAVLYPMPYFTHISA